MRYEKNIFTLILLTKILLGQFPVDLFPNEISDPYYFTSETNSEFHLTISAYASTNWHEENNESITLTVSIDDEWNDYNQDIVLYAGNNDHDYHVSLGPISKGKHKINFKFNEIKSSTNAESLHINHIDLININSLNIDLDILKHSPILYGRDLLSWNESTRTDIPLIMWHEISQVGNNKLIKYSIIFSNEDSRIGIGLSDLMYSYGRTTDIEWIYEVLLANDGQIINEFYQGASHVTTPFQGDKIGLHPILKNATLNCNFSDNGTSDYKFFPSPLSTITSNNTREILMDQNPWTYRIMAEELINEERYETNQDPNTLEISDVRNYIYIEYEGEIYGSDVDLQIIASFIDNCNIFINNHNYIEFSANYYGGIQRTSIELPYGFNPMNIFQLGFMSQGDNDYQISINNISRLFYLNENYMPIEISFEFSELNISFQEPEKWLTINENMENIDCFGIANGTGQCDDCHICNGNNLDMDDCNICFGGNADIDCNGICFGNSYEDECGICDDNPGNDNVNCSGCTDENANNFNETAIFDDGSCEYDDHVFLVPFEYESIQLAINQAQSGDTIEVAAGIYNENINYLGKALTIQSQYSEEMSISEFIINGVDSTSTVIIENTEASLTGFTIQNGYGPGISFDDFISMAADEEMFDSLITNVLKGGGISIGNSNVSLTNLHVTNNVSRNVGAGIGAINSNVMIQSCLIDNNIINDGDALGGGGIAINGGNVWMNDVNISNNLVGENLYSLNGGGGILCGFSFNEELLQFEINNSIIHNNTANIGAGIGALSGNLIIAKSLITNNTGNYGSAISLGEPLGLVINEIGMDIINSTIANNSGVLGVALINSAYMNSINSIFWNNGDIDFSPLPNNDQLNVFLNFSNSQQEMSGNGNINSDPLFLNIESYDYTLTSQSPCIDAGTYDVNLDGIQDIFEFSGDLPDMGAFEFKHDECPEITGDINEDGEINILDIIINANCIINNSCNNCSDINNDSQTNVLDIITLINIILNFI